MSQNSHLLFNRARAVIPGGVNSPVRAWQAVGGDPLFIAAGRGPTIEDTDGNRFVDYVGSYGPAILGHAHPRVIRAIARQAENGLGFGAPTVAELDLAETLCRTLAGMAKVRLLSSGTEAGMTALRLARAATGRPRIVKFDGCYHGHSDSLLVRAGSGSLTFGVPDSSGVPESLAALTLVAQYNSLESVDRLLEQFGPEIAAVVVEPVAANMGVVPPRPQFLAGLGERVRRNGSLLICDEVITGFRLRFGGAYEMYGLRPDLVMLGKIIGGGCPIGAVGGRAELMDLLAPVGPVYQAGTLSGSPLSVRAGLETLAILEEDPPYAHLEKMGARLEQGLRAALERSGQLGCVTRVGSLLTLFLGVVEVTDADQARRADRAKFARFFAAMLRRGIYLPPSQFEALFISAAHGEAEIDRTVEAAAAALDEVGG